MNLWLLGCLMSCFIGTWTPAVQAQGVFEDCCLAYHPHIKQTVLRWAHSYQHQDVSGSCNLPAVIFHFPRRHKRVCGNPKAKWVQNGMRLLNNRKKHHHGTSGNFQGFHITGKKLSSGTYRAPPFMFRGGIGSSKRNTSLQTTANLGKDLDHVTISGLIMMKAHDEPRLGRGLISRTKEGWFCGQPHKFT